MTAGFPVGYATAAPAYTHNIYAGANPAFPSGKNVFGLVCLHPAWHSLIFWFYKSVQGCQHLFRWHAGQSFSLWTFS